MVWFLNEKKEEKSNIDLEREIQKLKFAMEDMSLEITKLKSNYESWLKEKETYIAQLKERIEKKINYINSKENNISVKEQLKQKVLKRYGLKYAPTQEDNNTEDNSLRSED